MTVLAEHGHVRAPKGNNFAYVNTTAIRYRRHRRTDRWPAVPVYSRAVDWTADIILNRDCEYLFIFISLLIDLFLTPANEPDHDTFAIVLRVNTNVIILPQRAHYKCNLGGCDELALPIAITIITKS